MDAQTAVVILGGKEWRVPMLSAKQNRVIDPLILGLLPVFAGCREDMAATLARIGSKQYDALIEIAHVAISRLHPEMTRESFMELPITLPELIHAFAAIAKQTGVFQTAEEEPAPGEAMEA